MIQGFERAGVFKASTVRGAGATRELMGAACSREPGASGATVNPTVAATYGKDAPSLKKVDETTPATDEAAGDEVAKTEAVELSKVLQELKLERYQRACDRCGYDDWQEIVEMDGGALDTMVARLKLAPNHADRLLQHVRACRLKQQPHARGGRQPSNKDDDCVLL